MGLVTLSWSRGILDFKFADSLVHFTWVLKLFRAVLDISLEGLYHNLLQG